MSYVYTYPTTYPYGLFRFYQDGPSDDLRISGWMKQMPPPASGHGLHINYKPYTGGPYTGLCGNICHDHTVPRWDEQPTPTWTWDAGQMNGTPSQVGNLAMVFDNPLGEATYNAVA